VGDFGMYVYFSAIWGFFAAMCGAPIQRRALRILRDIASGVYIGLGLIIYCVMLWWHGFFGVLGLS
jgi:hypothetical protein